MSKEPGYLEGFHAGKLYAHNEAKSQIHEVAEALEELLQNFGTLRITNLRKINAFNAAHDALRNAKQWMEQQQGTKGSETKE